VELESRAARDRGVSSCTCQGSARLRRRSVGYGQNKVGSSSDTRSSVPAPEQIHQPAALNDSTPYGEAGQSNRR
jgi:hypothetical protein